MTTWERMILLQGVPAFAGIDPGRLSLVAGVCRERRYAPGEAIVLPGSRPERLLIAVGGAITAASGNELPVPFGLDTLLFDRDLPHEGINAGPEGALCLSISRSHLFTILGECPELALGLLGGHQQ